MKKKKIIKRLREAKIWLNSAANDNKKLVVPDCPHDEKAAFESGIIAMNVSAQSIIDELIRQIAIEKREYGGYVTLDDGMLDLNGK